MGLIGQHGGEADAGVVVDGGVQVLEAGAARAAVHLSGDATARADDAGQALDVEVNHVAGMLMLVARYGRGGSSERRRLRPHWRRMRLTVARLNDSSRAMRQPFQRNRRRAKTLSNKEEDVCRGERCGRELRSMRPARPRSR